MQSTSPNLTPLFSLSWDNSGWAFSIHVSAWFVVIASAICTAFVIWHCLTGYSFHNYEIDEAEIGIGTSKFVFRPNTADRQVAYAIWVELSTRKIGLPIDLDHDVIVEIYNSWYQFFSVTRSLIKTIPVTRFKRRGTQAIIKLSIEVLNEGLRPHLTQWHARFRNWYDKEIARQTTEPAERLVDPQQIQAKFPQFEALKADIERVNKALMRYRAKMHELVLTD